MYCHLIYPPFFFFPSPPVIAGHNLTSKAFFILGCGSGSTVNEQALPPYVMPMVLMFKWEVLNVVVVT